MTELNPRYLDKLAGSLFEDHEQKASFSRMLEEGTGGKAAVCWLPEMPIDDVFPGLEKSQFLDFVYLADENVNGRSTAHRDGMIYLLDHSSAFALSVLSAIPNQIASILDMCAAPGGKSVLSWKLLRPDFLMANESVNKRVRMLISNLSRCAISPCGVSCLDSKVLAEKYCAVFDLVIVDAPCSGQSLLARGESALGALNPLTIKSNANRQKRILANSAKCVTDGGYLAYITCTFSQEENEAVVEWFLRKFPDYQAMEVKILQSFRTAYSSVPAYRLFPQQGLGSGAFACILRKQGEKNISARDFMQEKFIWRLD